MARSVTAKLHQTVLVALLVALPCTSCAAQTRVAELSLLLVSYATV
jgi:hypothetical protein